MRKIKVLKGIDHVKKYPHMYIGETKTPDHLLTEVLDNALDEILNGYGDSLDLNINNDSVCIKDNGSGIPLHEMEYEGEKNYSVYFLCRYLFSGTKFDDKSYDKKVGQHGIGLVAVNALSDWLHIETKNKRFIFENSELNKVENIAAIKGSYICFKPSKQFFETTSFTPDIHINRLKWVKALFPEVKININNNPLEDIDLVEFVRNVLGLSEETPLFDIEIPGTRVDKGQVMTARILFTYDLADRAQLSPITLGIVNLRQAEGIFFNTIMNAIGKAILSKTNYSNLTKDDLKVRLRLFVDLRVNTPAFDSQNKVRYVGPSIKKAEDKIVQAVRKLFDESDYLRGVAEYINTYKLLKKANGSMKGNNSKKNKISLGSPLKDCAIHPGKRLYIVEGASAGNTLTQARDPKVEGVFPMQGKIINAESNALEKVLKNKFVTYLLEAIGVKKLGEAFTPRYEEFAILSDPDPDGLAIALLVTLVFYKLLPNLIKEGKLVVVKAPLYGYNKGKKFVPIYTVDEVKKLQQENIKIFRFKGLGEMTAMQLREIIHTGHVYKVKWTEEGAEHIRKLFSSSDEKRKLLSISQEEIEKILFS